MNFKCVKKFDGKFEKYVLISTNIDATIPNHFSEVVKATLTQLIKKEDFSSEKCKKIEMNTLDGDKVINVTFLYLGNPAKLNAKNIRENLYTGLKGITGEVMIIPLDEKSDNVDAIAEIIEHINYKFDKYLSEKKKEFLKVHYLTNKKLPKLIEGYELGKISNIVKDMINEPAEFMTPHMLAKTAEKLGKDYAFEVEILDEKMAAKLGMHSYLSVARAAHHRPYVIVMRYFGNPESEYKYGLVGKGLTYDTGGLSLKPTTGMVGMKEDMGGAATMIGAMCSIAKMQLKKNVTCVVAACENSIGPNAYRPGDIVNTMNGKTVEVTNTDAEGRLTLIDALTYIIRKEKVDEVIDAATLTGAILVALGEDVTGVFSNDNEAAKKLIAASDNWNEYFWQMPMFDGFKRYLKSDIADMQNTGSRFGGSVNAAKFLEEFVEGKKWIHLDIAGTVFANGGNPYYEKGPTGQVFKTIYSYIKA